MGPDNHPQIVTHCRKGMQSSSRSLPSAYRYALPAFDRTPRERCHSARSRSQPAMHDPLDDGPADMRKACKLSKFGPPFTRHVMPRHAMLAAELRPFLVDTDVAPDPAKNRREMAPKLLGDDVDTQASLMPTGDPATFVQVSYCMHTYGTIVFEYRQSRSGLHRVIRLGPMPAGRRRGIGQVASISTAPRSRALPASPSSIISFRHQEGWGNDGYSQNGGHHGRG